MFKYVTPENAGISSKVLLATLKKYEAENLAFHSLIIAKGYNIFLKAFWKPYNENSLHRMYSETKSFVGIAVCNLIKLGKIDPQKPIIHYFKDIIPENISKELQCQTVEDMLTMRTCMQGNYWFDDLIGDDRLKYYFSCPAKKEAGKDFEYDSDASFVLGCLVERITGKSLLEYLFEICLNDIGFSQSSHMLKTPGGHTWSDSALICKPDDILKFGRLLANNGVWDKKQILPNEVVNEAVKKQVDTKDETSEYLSHGYGYQIWKNSRNGFSFIGMHGQYMHYDPKTDIIFVCTSGNKSGNAGQLIYDGFLNIVKNTSEMLPEDSRSYNKLLEKIKGLTLFSLKGVITSNIEKTINNKIFHIDENPMGITCMSFSFGKDIVWKYENAQGKKELKFGRGENAFSLFPQSGYSKEVGTKPSKGHKYKCACSSAWETENVLNCKVQIIDEYIGILDLKFEFFNDSVRLIAEKDAEDFLKEYEGIAIGKERI